MKLEKNFANQARFNALPAKLPRKLLWSVLLYRSILCLGRGTKEAQSVIFAMTFFLLLSPEFISCFLSQLNLVIHSEG